eukprot:gi/632974841/ref/XP_007903900.1/ PREDICTED: tudor domain-containing protein 1-like [Callorhinchus milii]
MAANGNGRPGPEQSANRRPAKPPANPRPDKPPANPRPAEPPANHRPAKPPANHRPVSRQPITARYLEVSRAPVAMSEKKFRPNSKPRALNCVQQKPQKDTRRSVQAQSLNCISDDACDIIINTRVRPNFTIRKPMLEDSICSLPRKGNLNFCEFAKECFSDISNPATVSGVSGGHQTNDLIDTKATTGILPQVNGEIHQNSPNPGERRLQHQISAVGLSPFESTEGVCTNYSPETKISRQSPLQSSFATCSVCGLLGANPYAQCKQVRCSVKCQKSDWPVCRCSCKLTKINKLEEPLRAPKEKMLLEKKVLMNTTKALMETPKIRLADLKPIKLPKESNLQIVVTEFKDPNEFFVQILTLENFENLRRLASSLKETCADVNNQDKYVPEEGEICAAKFSVDQDWYRALVVSVNIVQEKARVLYIDYGNEEVVQLNRICPLKIEMGLSPPCAMKCCVANIPSHNSWSEECITSIKLEVLQKTCCMTIVEKLDDGSCFAVDVELPSGQSLQKYILEKRYAATQVDENSTESSVETLDKAWDNLSLNYSSTKIGSDDKLQLQTTSINSSCDEDMFIIVSHIETPDNFFCQQLVSRS